jgi:hypothetical protein
VASQQQVQAERRRLAGLQRKIKERWKHLVAGERARISGREEELANEACNLKEETQRLQRREQALGEERLRFHADYELGRRRLREAWQKLRQAQSQWRRRRHQERAALNVRARDLDEERVQVTHAARQLQRQQEAFEQRRDSLEKETEGLENRIRHQRQKLADQQMELNRLDHQLREREQPAVSEPPPVSSAPSTPGTALVPAARQGFRDALDYGAWESRLRLAEDSIARRVAELDRLAGDLADQRLQLAEQWHRLVLVHEHWHRERAEAADSLQGAAQELREQENALVRRARELEAGEAELRQRHAQLVELGQQVVAWRTRLRGRETAWESDRERVLTEIKHREELVEQQLAALMDLRQRWSKRRRQETDQLRSERVSVHQMRQELSEQRRQLLQHCKDLEDQKRLLTEKALALEQYRQAIYQRSGDGPAAERRIDRLRRRWIAQNGQVLRDIAHEREVLQAEMARLEKSLHELAQRSDHLAEAANNLAEKETAFEHKQTLAAAQQTRLQQEAQIAEAQRHSTEQQLLAMKDEVERIARSLLEEPDPPTLLMPKAA